jgi:hypothetical protein
MSRDRELLTELARFGLATALRTPCGPRRSISSTTPDSISIEVAAHFCCVEAAELLAPPLHTSVAAASDHLGIDVEGGSVRCDDLSMIIDRLLRSPAPQCSLASIALRIPAMPVTAASAAMTGAAAPG